MDLASVAEGVALRLAEHTAQYGKLRSAVIIGIDGSLFAGTSGQGMFGAYCERMRKLRDEVLKANGQALFSSMTLTL